MFQDVTKYVKECPRCQIAKGDYTEANTIPGVIIANNPMDLMFIDFTKVNPSKDGKENILVLTDAFTKFSQAFVTPNQNAITVTEILVDKWSIHVVFLHIYTVIKAVALTMRSCHICMLCTGLSSLQPCPTICVEMLPQKD